MEYKENTFLEFVSNNSMTFSREAKDAIYYYREDIDSQKFKKKIYNLERDIESALWKIKDRDNELIRLNEKLSKIEEKYKEESTFPGTVEWLRQFFQDVVYSFKSDYGVEYKNKKYNRIEVYAVNNVLYAINGKNNKRRLAILLFNTKEEITMTESKYREGIGENIYEFLGSELSKASYEILSILEKEAQYLLQNKFIESDDNKEFVLSLVGKIKAMLKK